MEEVQMSKSYRILCMAGIVLVVMISAFGQSFVLKAGQLLASDVGNGLTDAQVNDDLTISGGTINNTPIGAGTPHTGKFTGLTATGVLATSTITTFTANDTTPDVSGGNLFRVPDTWMGNNITGLDGGRVGQCVVIIGGDSDCIVSDGSHLKMFGNWTASPNDTLCVVYDGVEWYELRRSNN
jgi:hypothetical protein